MHRSGTPIPAAIGSTGTISGRGFAQHIGSFLKVLLLAATLASVFAIVADARPVRNALRGAAIGAGIGALVDGGRGARTGAITGALVGAIANPHPRYRR